MAAQAESLHQAAADVLRRSCKGEGTRQVLYAVNLPPAVKSQLQAIVLGAQNNENLIWTVARDCGFLHHVHPDLLEPDNKHLLVVLYEALLGSRRVRGTSKVVELVKNHKSLLQQQLAIHRKAGKAVCHQEKIKLPRFVRVNTIKVSMDEAIKHFELRGWKMSDGKDGGIEGNLLSPPKGRMMKDPQVPNLLVFPAGTSLHNDSLVDVGGVILQDRSSCLSAVALAPIPTDAVIADACAAPGNKTSHAASLLKLASERSDWSNSGVIAFERDPKRERMLRRQMQKFGCGEMVNVRGRDFAEAVEEAVAGAKHAEAEQLRTVTHVLVDPSCSGSGLVAQYHGSAGGVSTGEEDTTQHACGAEEHEQAGAGGANLDILALAREQVKLVLAGMSLPRVRAVVYSTCSVNRQENEDVVESILREAPADFELVKALPAWPHRGLASAPPHIAPLVVRATHDKDSTNGFFVARFERLERRALPNLNLKSSLRVGAEKGKGVKRASEERRKDPEEVAAADHPHKRARKQASSSAPNEQAGSGSASSNGVDKAQQAQHLAKPDCALKSASAVGGSEGGGGGGSGGGSGSDGGKEKARGAKKEKNNNLSAFASDEPSTHAESSERSSTTTSSSRQQGRGEGKGEGKRAYLEYRPVGPGTRPWALHKAHVKAQKELAQKEVAQRMAEEETSGKRDTRTLKPVVNKWARAIDVD